MSKYGEALGIMSFKIRDVEFNLKPKKGDFIELLEMLNKSKNSQDVSFMINFQSYILKILKRDVTLMKQEEEDLELFVEFNITDFVKEVLIAYRLATRDKVEEKEKEIRSELESKNPN